jgi:hypothetical protein
MRLVAQESNMKLDKFENLLEVEGIENQEEFLQSYGNESVIPGICMNAGCEYTTGVEPDQDEGWCEECETNTVQSGLILLGII